MNIHNSQSTFSFSSGLTTKISLKEHFISPSKHEKILAKYYGISSDFKNDKAMTVANVACAEIFSRVFSKLGLKFNYPPCIKVFERKCLLDEKNSNNFCIPDTKSVLKNDYPYPGRSVFFEEVGSLERVNSVTEELFYKNMISSSHFLAPFIHEWVHSFHLDYIYNKFGYGGKCTYLNEQYLSVPKPHLGIELLKNLRKKVLSCKEIECVAGFLGDYSINSEYQYLEIYTEAITKILCDCLKGTLLVKNPLELFREYPMEFQKIIKKVFSLSE